VLDAIEVTRIQLPGEFL